MDWLAGSPLGCGLARPHVEVLDQELPVMGSHLAIMPLGDRIGRIFSQLVEHFGFLPENRCIRHGSLLYVEHISVGRASETRGGMAWFSRLGEALEKTASFGSRRGRAPKASVEQPAAGPNATT
jgi:hypothetical protein